MTIENMTTEIRAALSDVPQDDAIAGARRLLETLGYRSDRTLELTGSVHDFIAAFHAPTPDTLTERDFLQEVASIHVVFQITNAEIAESVNAQGGQFTVGDIDKGNSKSFVFIAVELNEKTYPRGDYAKFTREINKRLNQPTVVLFKTADKLLTLAFVHRRPHKRDRRRKVLGSVSLIREIDTTNPHRAHLDILAKLALPERLKWMNAHHKPSNFDGLLDAWLDALDTEELNRSFYKLLFKWFERAVEEARFPTDQAKVLSSEEHIIRLITRLLFVWFIKEKGLIAPDLFIEEQVGPLLRDYNRENGDSYYRAVLQNLFFATLNSEIGERGFSKRSHSTHRDFSRYRYLAEIANPDGLLKLFAKTPFINGGLFDCLDSFESTTEGGYRIDSFTDNVIDPKRKEFGILSIPNRLFFDEEGLISLFERFQFTVEENTPAEQEVALDPELLGKVFENLLAAYNPETRGTARKQTGSYYTPREIVDYMVDESLVASLAQHCPPADNDIDFWKERLNYLLDYEDAFDDASELFGEDEKEDLVRAIAGIKLIDPAVGSGAFPMGALHKLTLALRRLDPDNQRWESLQKELSGKRATAAFDTRDQAERNAELEEISATFEKYRDSDFGRKLYLIQNSIYGVDIQPIACQIARLRFFISLAIEQEPGGEITDNYGIKPLPNLETRFVAANTLLRLDTSGMQMNLTTPEVTQLQEELNANRERHFHATTRQKKKVCRDHDRELRDKLATALQKVVGLPAADAANISGWDPYDQNAQAEWFDAGYMFGVTEGFDLVIGNPPYIQLSKDGGKLRKLYEDAGYATFASTGDIYLLFFEKGCRMLESDRGYLSYITSNSWLKAEYGKPLRRYLSERHTPLRLLEMGKDIFENAIVDTSILMVRSGKSSACGLAVDMDRLSDKHFPPEKSVWGQLRVDGEKHWIALSPTERKIIDKIEAAGPSLKEWDISIKYGIKTGYNPAFVINREIREAIIAENPKAKEILKRVMRGKDIQRYQARWADHWLIDTHNGYGCVPPVDVNDYRSVKRHLDKFYSRLVRRKDQGVTPYNLRDCAYHEEFTKPKLFWRRVASEGMVAYVQDEYQCVNAVYMLRGDSLKYLCAVLNSKLVGWYMRRSLPTSGTGTFHWEKVHVERLPVPKLPVSDQNQFNNLVERILAAKGADPDADIVELERKIDWLVYELYGLSVNEIAEVEEKS